MKSHPVLRLILKTAAVLAVLYIAASFVTLQTRLKREKEELSELKQNLAVLQQQNDRLSDMVENGIDDEYIIQKARELGYILPNEMVYDIPNN